MIELARRLIMMLIAFIFSQDSSKVAYFAFKNEKYFVVIDNKIEKVRMIYIDFIKGLIF